MRQIKFRAWDRRDNTMLTYNGMNAMLGVDFSGAIKDHHSKEDVTDHLVLQQFTGLLDKNGVEIYEGDIVRPTINPHFSTGDRTKSQALIKWNDKHAGFFVRDGLGVSWPVDETVEVIGNVHENPELLEVRS